MLIETEDLHDKSYWKKWRAFPSLAMLFVVVCGVFFARVQGGGAIGQKKTETPRTSGLSWSPDLSAAVAQACPARICDTGIRTTCQSHLLASLDD